MPMAIRTALLAKADAILRFRAGKVETCLKEFSDDGAAAATTGSWQADGAGRILMATALRLEGARPPQPISSSIPTAASSFTRKTDMPRHQPLDQVRDWVERILHSANDQRGPGPLEGTPCCGGYVKLLLGGQGVQHDRRSRTRVRPWRGERFSDRQACAPGPLLDSHPPGRPGPPPEAEIRLVHQVGVVIGIVKAHRDPAVHPLFPPKTCATGNLRGSRRRRSSPRWVTWPSAQGR